MNRHITLILCMCLVIACKKEQISRTHSVDNAIPWTDSSTQHPKNSSFLQLLDKYKRKGLPGISLLVHDKNGTWVGAIGKADIEHNVDFRPNTISKIASITKLFVGVLTFKLIEDSMNSGLTYELLHKPIHQFLPKRIIDRLPNGQAITLGQCLKHETGVPDLIDEENFYLAVLNDPNKKWTPEDLLSFIYDKEPIFNPSDTAIYSNTNTILVSLVLEAATGQRHSELLKKYLGPLGLTNTFYQPHDELPNTVAQGYFDLYNNNTIVNVSNLVTGSGNGYGGIYSNLFDLYKFTQAVLLERRFLTPKSMALLESFGKTDFPNQYGYGLMKKFIDLGINSGIGHSGRDVGYTANLFYFPNKKVTHIFLINYGTDGDSELKKVFVDFQEELLRLTLE